MISPKKLAGLLSNQLQTLSLHQQLMLLYGLLLTALTASTCFIVSQEIQSSNQHQADTIGKLLSSQTASATTDMLVTGDRLSLNVMLDQLVQNPYVAKAAIYSIDNRAIATAESSSRDVEMGETYSSPIHYQDVIAGYARLQLDERLLTRNPADALTVIITISVILLFAGLIAIHFFASGMAYSISLIERQLRSILPVPMNHSAYRNELKRLSAFVESQLTEKRMSASTEPEPEPEEIEETAAILSIRNKNVSRLSQLLTAQDLVDIINTQTQALEQASELYGGELSYTPEGTAYVRFSSLESETFAQDALACGLLIESLNRVIGEQTIASLQMGLGLCLSDGMPDFPGPEHPSQSNSAAGNALMLAGLPEPDALHMFKDQLNWLPAELPEIKVSEHGEDIIEVTGVSSEQAEEIKQQAYSISRELERA